MKQSKSLFKRFAVVTLNAFVGFLFFSQFILCDSFSQVEDVKRVVKKLCSQELQGRGYVNGGDSLAAEYIASEFQKAGLQNLTPNYFQRFSFPVNTFPGDFVFEIDNNQLEVGIEVIADPGSPSFNGTLNYSIFPASSILNANVILEELQKALSGESINSIALDFRNVHPDTFALIKSFKYELAQFIPVIVITDSKLTWSVSKEQIKHPVFEVKSSKIDGTPIIVKLDAVLKPEHNTKNVIGYLPASKKTNKTIVFTAHYDHLGKLGKNTYFPGANDNASGTAMLVALANYFKINQVKYNILFIAFAGEEIGLLGSKFYVENPVMPLKDVSFLLNLDIFGSGEDGITVVNGTIFKNHFDLLTKINEEKSLLKTVKPRGYAANSDHYWFTDAGVPSFFIYTMGPNKNYHDPLDTYENLSFAEVNDMTVLLSTFVERLKSVKPNKVKFD